MTGTKQDNGKAPLYQGVLKIFPRAIEAVAMGSKYGHDKYNEAEYGDNFTSIPENAVGRLTDSLVRHLTQEKVDPVDGESGLLHAQLVAWNALARLELMLRSPYVPKPDQGKAEKVENPKPPKESKGRGVSYYWSGQISLSRRECCHSQDGQPIGNLSVDRCQTQ